jgi:hypothetical protein
MVRFLLLLFVSTHAVSISSRSGLRSKQTPLSVFFKPEPCAQPCINGIIENSKALVSEGRFGVPGGGIGFMKILTDARSHFNQDGLTKMLFSVISDTTFNVIYQAVPDFRRKVEDKWIEIRENSNSILSSEIDGGVLRFRRTSLLQDARDMIMEKADEPLERVCSFVPEVGVSLGVEATLPLADWCTLGVKQILKVALLDIQEIVVKFLHDLLGRGSAGMSHADRLASAIGMHSVAHEVGIQFLEKILTKPVGDLVSEVEHSVSSIMDDIQSAALALIDVVSEKVALSEANKKLLKDQINGELCDCFLSLSLSPISSQQPTPKLISEIGSLACKNAMCVLDRTILTATVLLDKTLIWSSLIAHMEGPLRDLLLQINDIVQHTKENADRVLSRIRGGSKRNGESCTNSNECTTRLCIKNPSDSSGVCLG